MNRARVLLADDHRAFLAAVRRLLAPEFEVVGEAGDGVEAVRLARALTPDVLVLDCTMPRQGGLEAARELGASGSTTAIVFLSVSDDPAIVTAALDAGAQAYVPKARTATDLLPAIRTALAGRGFLSDSPPQKP